MRRASASGISAALVSLVAGSATSAFAQPRDLNLGERWHIAGAFPRSEPGPLERQAKPVTAKNPIPRRVSLVRPPYPSEAALSGVRATVTLRATLDHLGTVAEVRLAGVPVVGAVPTTSSLHDGAAMEGLQALARAAKQAVEQWVYEPPAAAPIAFDVVIGFAPEKDGELIAQGGSRSELLQPTGSAPHVGSPGLFRGPRKLKHVAPIYPAAAREQGISGVVLLEARIEPDGRILEAKVIASKPALDAAALEAVKQWEFAPTIVNGVPTPVTITLAIQFSLP